MPGYVTQRDAIARAAGRSRDHHEQHRTTRPQDRSAASSAPGSGPTMINSFLQNHNRLEVELDADNMGTEAG
jgi:hypothetical protein